MKKNKRFMFFSVCLLCLMVGFILIGNITQSYAKFVKQINDENSAIVANVNLVISDPTTNFITYSFQFDNINPTSQEKVYTFTIANGTEEKISETALLYNITLEKTENLPLNIYLKDSSENTILTLNPTVVARTTIGYYAFGTGVLNTHNYSIVVGWNSENQYKSADYQGLIDLITLKINYEQID